MAEKEVDKYLSSIYFKAGHPASYAGTDKLYETIKKEGKFRMSKNKINEWISKQDGFSLQKQIKHKVVRPTVIVSGIDTQWDMDTGCMNRYSRSNDGYKYIMLAIDIFSKLVWTRPLHSRLAGESTKQMSSILKEVRKPRVIRTNDGTEYKNSKFKFLLKSNNIKFIYTENETKANYAERAIKTIKTKLIRYMTDNNTDKWVKILPESYNNTIHRSIDMAPTEVTRENETELWMKLYPNISKNKELKREQHYRKIDSYFKLQVSANVRISQLKRVFQKEYNERWSREIFTINDWISDDQLEKYR